MNHMTFKLRLRMVMAGMMAAAAAVAGELFVSPTGVPDGDGSKSRPLNILTAIATNSPAKPGDTVYLLAGTYNGPMTQDVNRVPLRLPFEVKVSGTADKPIRILPAPGAAAHLNGNVNLAASYLYLIGLDIGDLQWDPWDRKHKAPTALNATGGESAKVINCNIFGGSMGTGIWSPARNTELYGNLIHDFGVLEKFGRGHGHASYTQNQAGTKVFRHNIAYRGCGWNFHAYCQGSSLQGFDVIENIWYIAGTRKPGQNTENMTVAGYLPADSIRLLGNVVYQSIDAQRQYPNARLSSFKDVLNGTALVKDNYLMGAFYGLSLSRWKAIEVTGNTIWSTGILIEINSAPTHCFLGWVKDKPDLAGFKLHDNTYIANRVHFGKAFHYGNSESVNPDNLCSFKEWQALGLDSGSVYLEGRNGQPTGTKVFVFPNQHEKGRANIGIFNWDGKKTVAVDLSPVLEKGQPYRVYNCLDIRQTLAAAKPVLAGTYEGGAVAMPMRADDESPDFDAFLVMPGK